MALLFVTFLFARCVVFLVGRQCGLPHIQEHTLL